MENQNPMPGSGGQVPPPPTSGSVDIRTQQSDIQSIKQSGGSSPQPTQFNLGQSVPSSPSPSAPSSMDFSGMPPAPPSLPADNFGLPPSVPSGNEPVFNPAPGAIPPAPEGGADFKKISLIIGVVVAVAALIWVGYVYLYPLFFSASPLVELPPPAQTVTETPPSPPPIVHSSFINFGASASSLSIPVAGSFRSDLSIALSAVPALTSDSITEVKVQNALGEQGSWSFFLNLLLPEITAAETADIFADDFTAFVYTDSNLKSWPGFVAKLKPSASLVDAGLKVRALESSIFLSNLFLSDPGAPAVEGFKDGQVGTSIPTRYLTYSSGAAIDYLWYGDYFVLVTSYPGVQKVLPLIQTSTSNL